MVYGDRPARVVLSSRNTDTFHELSPPRWKRCAEMLGARSGCNTFTTTFRPNRISLATKTRDMLSGELALKVLAIGKRRFESVNEICRHAAAPLTYEQLYELESLSEISCKAGLGQWEWSAASDGALTRQVSSTVPLARRILSVPACHGDSMNRRDFLTSSTIAAAFRSTAAPHRQTGDADVWECDGVGRLGRFGVLTPDFDPVPESELWAMLPRGFSAHTSRIPRSGGRGAGVVSAPFADEAVDRLVELRPSAILLGYTSSSYALGAKADEEARLRLQQCAKGIEVIFTAPSAVAALRKIGAHRVAVLHPPWWAEEANEQGRSYFRDAGFTVLVCKRMPPDRGFSEVEPEEVFKFVVEQTPGNADAVFLGGNGMRVIGTIRALEKKLGRPVLSANQVLLWYALSRIGDQGAVTRYGSLFSRRA